MKTPCCLNIVYLKKGNQEIRYGDLTLITDGLPKSKVVEDKRVKVHYEKSYYEEWQHKYAKQIVNELNELLPNACTQQKTMYYFTKQEIVKVAL